MHNDTPMTKRTRLKDMNLSLKTISTTQTLPTVTNWFLTRSVFSICDLKLHSKGKGKTT